MQGLGKPEIISISDNHSTQEAAESMWSGLSDRNCKIPVSRQLQFYRYDPSMGITLKTAGILYKKLIIDVL